MINIFEVNETNKMIEQEKLDVRTITLGCIRDRSKLKEQGIYRSLEHV